METQKGKKLGPPNWVLRVLNALAPREHGRVIIGDLLDGYVTTGQYLRLVAWETGGIVLMQVREALLKSLILGEAMCLGIAFGGAPLLPTLIYIAVALVVFRMFDGFLYPPQGGLLDARTEAVAGALLMAGFESVLVLVAPSLAMEGWTMVRGTVLGMVMATALRMIARGPSREPRRQAIDDAYNAVWQLNAVWMAAGMVLIFSNIEAVPAVYDIRDTFFIIVPLLAFGGSYALPAKLEKGPGPGDRIETGGVFRSYSDELVVKRAWLFGKGTGVEAILLYIAFASVSVPFFLAIGRWLSGDASTVDWIQLGVNAGAFAMLSVLWMCIRRRSQRLARMLDEEIDTLRRAEA